MKVLTVVGTRPEIIRLAPGDSPSWTGATQHVLVHTGQNYDHELNQIFFDELELRAPDHVLQAAGKTPAETVGLVIARVDEVLAKEAPDAVLILGDTNSCLAAYPAKRRKIPVFHMEAGNRCFDQRVPEEINRRIVDHLSDINLPYSSIGREYLLREGLAARPRDQDGQPHGRGPPSLHAQNRKILNPGSIEPDGGRLFPPELPSGRERRGRRQLPAAHRLAASARFRVWKADHHDDPSADAKADRTGRCGIAETGGNA